MKNETLTRFINISSRLAGWIKRLNPGAAYGRWISYWQLDTFSLLLCQLANIHKSIWSPSIYLWTRTTRSVHLIQDMAQAQAVFRHLNISCVPLIENKFVLSFFLMPLVSSLQWNAFWPKFTQVVLFLKTDQICDFLIVSDSLPKWIITSFCQKQTDRVRILRGASKSFI